MAMATVTADAPVVPTWGGGGGRARAGQALGWALAALGAVVVILLLAAPGLIAHVSPVAGSTDILKAPGSAHWFGTDQLGRDVFSRTVYGARPVLIASLLGVLVAIVAGVAIGLAAGTAPRWLNAVIMRVIDVLLAIPVLMIALILIATAGSGVRSIVIAIGVAFTPGFARVVETSVRKLRAVDYVEAARVFGSSRSRTSLRHLLPNLMTEVIVLGTSAIGWAVLTATTLSFLGLGVQLPQPDWGSDLAAGATYLSTSWWLSTFPGLGITVTILLANFTGDSLMAALDPREGLRPLQSFRSLVLGQRRPRPWERAASGAAPETTAATAPEAADGAVPDRPVRTEDGQ